MPQLLSGCPLFSPTQGCSKPWITRGSWPGLTHPYRSSIGRLHILFCPAIGTLAGPCYPCRSSSRRSRHEQNTRLIVRLLPLCSCSFADGLRRLPATKICREEQPRESQSRSDQGFCPIVKLFHSPKTKVGSTGGAHQLVAGYLRSWGWRDLIFLCVVAALWVTARRYLSQPSDYAKWKASVRAEPGIPISPKPGHGGLPPCFFIVPHMTDHQTPASGSIDDCLPLLPDGQKLDLFEIALDGGFFPIKTDLYVSDTIPLAFTRTYVPRDCVVRPISS